MKKLTVGRPRLKENEKKKANLRIRLLESEVEKIRKLYGFSKETSQSEMIRKILFQNSIPVKVENLELKELNSELKMVCQNLGRISRNKHFEQLKEDVEVVRQLYDPLFKKVEQLQCKILLLKDLEEFTESEKRYYNWY